MVLTGDVAQSDLNRHVKGGFSKLIDLLAEVEGVGISVLTAQDIIRNPIIGRILEQLEKYEN